jgi:hypothetical protein
MLLFSILFQTPTFPHAGEPSKIGLHIYVGSVLGDGCCFLATRCNGTVMYCCRRDVGKIKRPASKWMWYNEAMPNARPVPFVQEVKFIIREVVAFV